MGGKEGVPSLKTRSASVPRSGRCRFGNDVNAAFRLTRPLMSHITGAWWPVDATEPCATTGLITFYAPLLDSTHVASTIVEVIGVRPTSTPARLTSSEQRALFAFGVSVRPRHRFPNPLIVGS